MTNQSVFLQEWFKKRSRRERIYLFLSGFVFLYVVYFIFFARPVLAQKKDLTEMIASLQAQQITIQQQINNINVVIKTPIFLQMLAQQKRLTQQLAKMQKQLDSLKPTLFSAEDMPILTKKILNQQRDNVTLISIEELPPELLPTQNKADNTGTIDQTNILNSISGVYQHVQRIEFQDDYFNTIDYLKRLEKISWNMYWDSMDYKVLQYPKADVVIKFHVLSLQKS